jgi:hypothetical protein
MDDVITPVTMAMRWCEMVVGISGIEHPLRPGGPANVVVRPVHSGE